jgi:acetolactate synthase-1/2/3 large subunit
MAMTGGAAQGRWLLHETLNAVRGRAVFPHADVALVVDSRFIDTRPAGRSFSPARRYIYLNADASAWSPPRPASLSVLADAKLVDGGASE